MVELGKYEFVVKRALEQIGSGPWSARDLQKAKDLLIDHEFCVVFDKECDSGAAHDWLKVLSDRECEDLLARLNASRSQNSASVSV